MYQDTIFQGLQNKAASSTNRESGSSKKKISKPVLQSPRIIDGALVVEIDVPDPSKPHKSVFIVNVK